MSNVFDDIVHIAKAQSDAYSAAYQAGHAEGRREAGARIERLEAAVRTLLSSDYHSTDEMDRIEALVKS